MFLQIIRGFERAHRVGERNVSHRMCVCVCVKVPICGCRVVVDLEYMSVFEYAGQYIVEYI